MEYDLEKRVIVFGKNIIAFLQKVNITTMNENCIKQLLKSATSVGADFMEANQASSVKDFRHKIYIARKEGILTAISMKL